MGKNEDRKKTVWLYKKSIVEICKQIKKMHKRDGMMINSPMRSTYRLLRTVEKVSRKLKLRMH